MIKLLLFVCCFNSVQNNEPVIGWDTAYKLSWKDFKGTPQNNTSAAAITASGITFGYSMTETDKGQVVSFTTEVEACFYPRKSWYKPTLINDNILHHEQLHFDITELYARKFRYQINLLKVSNSIKNDLKKLNLSINGELSLMQNKYDEETNHSRNIKAQVKWEAYIVDELNKLSKYKLVN